MLLVTLVVNDQGSKPCIRLIHHSGVNMSQIIVGTNKLMIFHKGGLRYARAFRWDGRGWCFIREYRV